MILEQLVTLANLNRDKTNSHIQSLGSAHQYLLLHKLFKKFVPKSSIVLDWGTGNGHFSYFLCQSGYKTIGFSLESFYFKEWMRGFKYKFVKGNPKEASKLPFKGNFFNVVVSVGVLEHVRECGGSEDKSLTEIRRILKPEGLFICYHLPNKYSLMEFLGKLKTNNFHHQYRYTKNDIITLARANNFKIIKVGRYGFLPRNILSKLPYRLRFSTSLAYLWDILDNLLSFFLSPFCQNYFFVAQKKLKKASPVLH